MNGPREPSTPHGGEQVLKLVKCAGGICVGFGGFMLLDTRTSEIVLGKSLDAFSATADDVESYRVGDEV